MAVVVNVSRLPTRRDTFSFRHSNTSQISKGMVKEVVFETTCCEKRRISQSKTWQEICNRHSQQHRKDVAAGACPELVSETDQFRRKRSKSKVA